MTKRSTGEMKVGRRGIPLIGLTITFRRYDDEHPPYAVIDVAPEDDSDVHGGVALNGVSVGNLSTLEELGGLEFSFERDGDGDSEMAESLFWQPPNDNLEIESLKIKFGAVTSDLVEVEMRASCFDLYGKSDIPVTLKTVARVAGD